MAKRKKIVLITGLSAVAAGVLYMVYKKYRKPSISFKSYDYIRKELELYINGKLHLFENNGTALQLENGYSIIPELNEREYRVLIKKDGLLVEVLTHDSLGIN